MLKAVKIRMEYVEQPTGLGGIPWFGWVLESDRKSVVQKSYQLQIAEDLQFERLVYDSGFVESEESVHVEIPWEKTEGQGIYLMVEKRQTAEKEYNTRWQLYAVLSAVFAALTSVLAKIGITGVESNLGTAIRTIVVLVMSWLIVFIKGKQIQLKQIDKKEIIFISLSGLATGASWLCYYYAIQNGIVSLVVPVDKLSILITVAFSYVVFREKLSRKAFLGLLLMTAGTLIMTLPSL